MVFEMADKLRSLRLKLGLSQKEIANQMGVSPSAISAYELGERTPSVEVLLAFTSLYRCSSDYLLGLKQNVPQRTLDVSGLPQEQIYALQALIQVMRGK